MSFQVCLENIQKYLRWWGVESEPKWANPCVGLPSFFVRERACIAFALSFCHQNGIWVPKLLLSFQEKKPEKIQYLKWLEGSGSSHCPLVSPPPNVGFVQLLFPSIHRFPSISLRLALYLRGGVETAVGWRVRGFGHTAGKEGVMFWTRTRTFLPEITWTLYFSTQFLIASSRMTPGISRVGHEGHRPLLCVTQNKALGGVFSVSMVFHLAEVAWNLGYVSSMNSSSWQLSVL